LDRTSLNQAMPDEPPHVAEDERALIEVLEHPPAPGLPVPRLPENFFRTHPICRRLPVDASSTRLVADRATVFLG
jgi:hypothetical protein